MTNEQYLYVSYFAAAAGGACLAVVSAVVMARPHRLATAGVVVQKLGALLRRVFPVWLVLAVLLGFLSVSYIDCAHSDYAQVVEDRQHLVHTTQDQASAMMQYLAVALLTYGFVLMLLLWARARRLHKKLRPR